MTCRIHQWRLRRNLSAGEGLSPTVRRHLARCEPCRELHRQWSAVQARLRAEAADAPALSEALVARIVRAASAGQAAPIGGPGQTRAAPGGRLRPPPHLIVLARRRPWAAALAAAACAALAAGVAYLLWPAGLPATAGGNQPGPVAVAAVHRPATPTPTDALTRPSWPDVRELAAAPLEAEIRCLADETRQIGSALLAPLPRGLLPPSAHEGLEGPDQPRRNESRPPERQPRPAGADPAPPSRTPELPSPTGPLKPASLTPAGVLQWFLMIG